MVSHIFQRRSVIFCEDEKEEEKKMRLENETEFLVHKQQDLFSNLGNKTKLENENKKQMKETSIDNLKNYKALSVAETDFYVTDPQSPDNQIRFDDYTLNKKMENLAYRNDSPYMSDRVRSERHTATKDKDSFQNPNYLYGWGAMEPKVLQVFNKPLWFLIFLCVGGIAQGLVVTGVAFTILTSIEKQYGFSSSHVALFGTVYDSAYGVFCVFVGYFGHKHKPRWLGTGFIIMALGAVVTSIPKYIFGVYEAGKERNRDFCQLSTNSSQTPECGSSAEWYYTFIFLAGNALIGIGATPLYILGPAHLDEITHRGQNGFYSGIFYAATAVGPALGFIIGKPILSTWVDINQPAKSNLTPDDRNWVGAWWIGYLVGAVILLLPVFPMLGFPAIFPNTEKVREQKSGLEDTIEENKNLNHDFKSIWPATKSLLKNTPFICICLASATESIAIGGFSTFLSKFVETQFHFTAANSGLYTGIIVIPGAAGGMLVGGYLLKRYQWKCNEILRAASIMAFLSTVCVLSTLIGCGGRDVAGVDVAYYNTTSLNGFDSSCNQNCQCSTRYYKPVCSVSDQLTYYSPCHAGCSSENAKLIDGVKHFINCTCLPDGPHNKIINGRCKPDCNLFPVFFVCAFLMMFFTFMNNVPMLMATLRVVPEGQGSFAMGFQQIFIRFFGFVPAPILFGRMIDQSCKLWHRDECTGKTTSCLEYENANFRYYTFLLGIVTKFLSFVFIFCAYKTYKLPTNTAKANGTSSTGTNETSNGNVYDMKNFADSTSSCEEVTNYDHKKAVIA